MATETTPPPQVQQTPAAAALIARLAATHGPLMFHQSGGCCDGSSPMCYPRAEFLTGDNDIQLGTVGDQQNPTPFFISRPQFEYWKHTELTLDVVPGRGGMFSLEGPEGVRFHIRSRLFTPAELAALTAASRL